MEHYPDVMEKEVLLEAANPAPIILAKAKAGTGEPLEHRSLWAAYIA